MHVEQQKHNFIEKHDIIEPYRRHFLSVHIVSTFFVCSLRLANFDQVFVIGVFWAIKLTMANEYRRIPFFRIAKIKQNEKGE